MSYDTVVIGAGLAGLTAALRLADEGAKVLVIAKGVGSTHLSPATIDVLGFDGGRVESPAEALPAFTAAHPDHPALPHIEEPEPVAAEAAASDAASSTEAESSEPAAAG